MANRSASWADWDLELLAAEFGDLQVQGFDLSLTGFDAREIGSFPAAGNTGPSAA